MQKSLFRKPIKPISQSKAQKSDLLTEIFRPAKIRKSLFRLRINICSLLFYENILSKKVKPEMYIYAVRDIFKPL